MLVGFGTRYLLDRTIRPFVQREGGTFYKPILPNGTHVAQFEKTKWPGFDMSNFKQEKPDVAIFGILRGVEEILWACKELGINYYYFDHAYFFKGHNHKANEISNILAYRVTKNAENLTRIVELDDVDKNRIIKYRKFTDTFRLKNIKRGQRILIVPPTEAVCRYYKIDNLNEWENQVRFKVKKYSDRTIVVRRKTDPKPLESDLQNAHCVITYQSTVGITSMLKGVPVICDDVSMCKPVSINFEDIEKKYIRDDDLVNKWIDSLLANQFTMEEIQNGTAKRIVDKYDNHS
jgi:glycosyltransferase involved in cell wall biosynthesis